MITRVAGLLMLGVFVANVYVGVYDSNLTAYSMLHYYLNWLIALVDVVAVIFLLLRPSSKLWVSLSGIAWPIVYLLSLVVDVEASLCLGTNVNCWPSPSDAFQYLILGSTSEGWNLWPYTMLTSIALLILVIALSVVTVVALRRQALKKEPSQVRSDKPDETAGTQA